MELDDLKTAWQSLDRRLADQHERMLHILEGNKLAEARSKLRPLAFAQGIKMAAGIAMSLLFGPTWIGHLGTFHLMIPGLLLHAFGILLIVDAARELHLIFGIDPAEPVVAIQKRLARLASWRVLIGQISGVVWCFLWIPLVLVVFSCLGADLWTHSPQVVYWFLASGLVCLGLLLGVRRVSLRAKGLNVGRYLDRSSEGRSLQRARGVLDEILAFERE